MKRLSTYSVLVSCSIAILTISMIQCKKEEIPVVELKTYEATDITASSVTIEGEIVSTGGATITKKGICISKSSDPTPVDGQILSTSTSNKFSVEVTDLRAKTKFYYRAFAVSSAGVFYGEESSFSTVAGLPNVQTADEITDITATSATSGGNITSDEGSTVTARGVVWNTEEQPTLESNQGVTNDGTGTGSWVSELVDLQPETLYYVRAYATNSVGTAYGNQVTFTAEGSWLRLENFGGTERSNALGFSINGKGYIGLGAKQFYSTSYEDEFFNDLWQYDPVSNTWTQKADYPGIPRYGSISFVINSLAYIGGGRGREYDYDNEEYVYPNMFDFWSYDPESNTWLSRADIPCLTESGAFFSLNGKGYCGLSNCSDQVWEYNPLSDSWDFKAYFPGDPRHDCVSFSIEGKGYAGLGWSSDKLFNDFWEYEPETDTWTQLSDFPGIARYAAKGFSLLGYGYVVLGYSGNALSKDLWQFNPSTNSWSQKSDFEGQVRFDPVSFTLSGKAYVGTGGVIWDEIYYTDFWEYDPSQEED